MGFRNTQVMKIWSFTFRPNMGSSFIFTRNYSNCVTKVRQYALKHSCFRIVMSISWVFSDELFGLAQFFMFILLYAYKWKMDCKLGCPFRGCGGSRPRDFCTWQVWQLSHFNFVCFSRKSLTWRSNQCPQRWTKVVGGGGLPQNQPLSFSWIISFKAFF